MIGLLGGDGGRAAVVGNKNGRRVVAAPDDAHDGAGLLRRRAAHWRSVYHCLHVTVTQKNTSIVQHVNNYVFTVID